MRGQNILLSATFSITIFLFTGISYAHCYGSSVSPTSGDTYTTFKFCGSTNDLPNLLVDGNSKGSMSTASSGDCTDNSGTEYKFTLTGTGLSSGSHDYKVFTGHGDCTGTFEIKSSTTTTTTTTATDEGPYTGGSTQYSWSGSGYSIWQSILKVKEDKTLKGVEQYMTDITTGKKYWAVVIDMGTSKPSSSSPSGTVLLAKELGTTSSSTTGWVGTTSGLDVQLKKDHWYVIGVAVDSSTSRKWYYKSSSTAVDFGWSEFQPGSYYDTQNPPDSSVGACTTCSYLLYTRFYLKVTSPETADTTSPTVTVTGASSGWTKSGTASISCTDSSGCDSASYKLKTYTSNPTTCSNKYEDYTLNIPYTTDSNVWVCGAAKDTKGNVGFSSPVEFKVDKDAPSISLDVYKSEQTYWYWVAKVKCSDSLSGCDSTTYAIYKSTSEITSCPQNYNDYTVTPFIYIYSSQPYLWICGAAKDTAGNIGYTSSPIKESTDNSAPSTTTSLSGTLGDNNWYKSSVDVTLTCFDRETGCKTTYYCTDTTNTCSPDIVYSSSFDVTGEGTNYVRYYSTDKNLNSEKERGTRSTTIKIDTIKPITTAWLSGTEESNGWHTSDVKVSFTCSDATSECKETKYCTDTTNICDPATKYSPTSEIKLTAEGTNYVRYNSADNAGNLGDIVATTIKLDKTNPDASISINNGDAGTVSRDVTLSLTYSDAASGVDKCRYSNEDEKWTEYETCSNTKSWKLTSGYGTKTVHYEVKDNAGKFKQASDTIDYKSKPMLISISSSQSFVKYGDSLTISSVASDDDNDKIKLECGSKTQSNDICIGQSVSTKPSCSFTSSWKDELAHTVYCRVYDGTLYSEEKTVSITSDNTKPSANIDSPSASAWFKNDFTLQYDATDTNIDGCSISTKDGAGNWIEISTTCGDNKQLTITVGTGKYCATEGKDVCSVKVYAKDKAANSNEVTRSFSIDLTSPVIDSISHSPPEGITPDTDVTITVKASDKIIPAGYSGLGDIKVYADGQLKQTCNSSPCLYTSKYAAGTHQYYAEASDKATNKVSSSTQSFKSVIPETVSLQSNWNLMSIPYVTFNFISSTCESDRNFYNYDTLTKAWTVVENVKDLQGGKGYWIYSTKSCEIKILGIKEVLSNDIQLKTGWNQIGSPDTEPNFQSIKGGCTMERILSYDSLINNWKVLTGNDKLEKYKGYFVKASC